MVETQAVISGVQQGGSIAGLLSLVVLFIALLGLIIWFLLYRRSFNIDIVYIPFNGEPPVTGLKGKDYFRGKSEYRFKIWNARRHKLKYNEEAVTPDDITIHKTADGKIRRLIWMSSDSTGMLIPIKIKPETLQYSKKTIENGKEKEEIYTTKILQAKYDDVDVSWLQMEKEKWINVFKPHDKSIFWGLIIIGIIMLLALGGFVWGVSKNVEVAKTNQQVAKMQAESNALMMDSLCLTFNKCLNTTSTGQTITTIIQS